MPTIPNPTCGKMELVNAARFIIILANVIPFGLIVGGIEGIMEIVKQRIKTTMNEDDETMGVRESRRKLFVALYLLLSVASIVNTVSSIVLLCYLEVNWKNIWMCRQWIILALLDIALYVCSIALVLVVKVGHKSIWIYIVLTVGILLILYGCWPILAYHEKLVASKPRQNHRQNHGNVIAVQNTRPPSPHLSPDGANMLPRTEEHSA